jgi:uroporphyrinogen-III synthase
MNGISDRGMIVSTKNIVQKEIKRERILEAASYLFSTHNYHEVMMDDVAKKLSIAKGTLYLYFSSKEELYFTIIQSRLEKLVNSLREKISGEKSVTDSIKTFVIHTYMFMMKYRNFFLMYEKEKLNADNNVCSAIKNLEEERLKILIDIIERGKSQKIFKEIESELAADMAVNVIYAAIKRGIEKNISDENKIAERESIFEFILSGLLYDETKLVEPLINKTLLIARNLEHEDETTSLFKKVFKSVIFFPSNSISSIDDYSLFDSLIKTRKFDYLIFSSSNAVEYFNKRLIELNMKFDFSNCKVIAVGEKTKSTCLNNEIKVDFVPTLYSAKGVIELLQNYDITGKNILIPGSEIARDELPTELTKLKTNVFAAPIYTVRLPNLSIVQPYLEKLNSGNVDWFVFTSPSSYINFLKLVGIENPTAYFQNKNIAVIGPTTKEAVNISGVDVTLIPSEYTLEEIIKEINNYYNRK